MSEEKPDMPLSAALNRNYDAYMGARPETNDLYTQFKYTKLKGFDYNELFQFNDFLPTFAEAAGIPIPKIAEGKSFYPLLTNHKQAIRETVFIHYDPLRRVGNKQWFGRFVRNKTYKLYSDNRFYNVGEDSEEKKPLADSKLTKKELLVKEQFQAELNRAPPHSFIQSDNYPKKNK